MNEYNSANVTSRQPVFGQITSKNHIFEFFNHGRLLRKGWAVMNLGTSPSSSINQAVRTFNRLPSAAVKRPSMTYRVPNIVRTSRVISLSFACCFKALASSSHRDESNPNCMKKEALLLPARWVVERRYLTIFVSLISALSTSGSFMLNLCCASNAHSLYAFDSRGF